MLIGLKNIKTRTISGKKRFWETGATTRGHKRVSIEGTYLVMKKTGKGCKPVGYIRVPGFDKNRMNGPVSIIRAGIPRKP